MQWKNFLGISFVSIALIVCGVVYLDVRLAKFLTELVGLDLLVSYPISNLPDLLFYLVCILTVLSWAGRIYFSRKAPPFLNLVFLESVGISVPSCYILKQVLKELCGRTNARLWLLHPDQIGFHWFHGGGDYSSFPSGHMAVITALMLAVSRYFPPMRPVCAGLLFLLALALLATQYHFFSDIMAGFYLGLIVHLLSHNVLSLRCHWKHSLTGRCPSAGATEP